MTLAIVPSSTAAGPAEDPYVLAGRPLRPGARLEDTCRYSHDVWHLRPAQLQEQQRALSLNFTTLPPRFHPAAKKIFYSFLALPPPPGENIVELPTIRNHLVQIKRFLNWLDQRWEPLRRQLSALTPRDLDDYQRHLLVAEPSPTVRYRNRGAIRMLWRWRQHLGEHALQFDPRHLDGWGESKQARDSENLTDRLPEAVLGPLLAWSLRFIDDFAQDILAADAQWHRHRSRARQRGTSAANGERLRALLDEFIAAGKPLPGCRGKPDVAYFARELSCGRSSIHYRMAWLEEAAEIVGIHEGGHGASTIHGRLDGEPWIEVIVAHRAVPTALAWLARHLQTAAYVVIAFLSGMRDSEVKHLRRGCLDILRDEDGTPYRWRVNSTAFKGEDDAAGTPAAWIVGEPVARAVSVLEALQPADRSYLFSRLTHHAGVRKGAGAVVSNKATNEQLNRFVDFVNDYCTKRGRSDTIPVGASTTARLKTSQFRRTLAWFIARRPGGVIAGAFQYRHHSVQMFEGYAGTSASGFRAEVESEQAIARGEDYMCMIETHEHTELAGPAAEEAARRLTEFEGRIQFRGQVVLDKHRLARVMKRHDPAVFPGIYITCVHDPAKALCDKARRGRSEGLPEHGGCQPLACRNVALTSANAEAWKRELSRIDKRLASRPTLAPLIQHRLRQRQAEITDFLQANGIEAGLA